MVFEFGDLIGVFIMNVCEFVAHVLIFSNQEVPVVFQFVSYVVKIFNFPFCFCQFLLYAQLLLLVQFRILVHLLVFLL